MHIKNIIQDKFFFKKLLDAAIEFFIYVAIIGITFSNAVTEVGVGVSIFLFLIKKFTFKEPFPKIKLIQILLVFLAFNILSTLYSYYLYDGFYLQNNIKGIIRIIKYLFFFVVVTYISSKSKSINRLIYIFMLASVVICFDALFQYFTGTDLFRHRTLIKNDYLRRLSAAFVHPNDFGAYLITIIPIYIGLFYHLKKNWQKIFTFICLLLLSFCLFKTASRGAWLGFLIAVLVFIIARKDKILMAIILAFFILSPFLLPKNTLERIKQSFDTSSGTIWERKQIWKGTINIIKVHPLIGFGPNTFSDNFPKYKPKDYSDNRYAHNSYLQIAAEVGIAGLGLFLAILFLILKTGFTVFKKIKGHPESNIILGILCGLIAFLIQSGVDTNLFSLVLVTLFWIIAGMIFGLYNTYAKEKN